MEDGEFRSVRGLPPAQKWFKKIVSKFLRTEHLIEKFNLNAKLTPSALIRKQRAERSLSGEPESQSYQQKSQIFFDELRQSFDINKAYFKTIVALTDEIEGYFHKISQRIYQIANNFSKISTSFGELDRMFQDVLEAEKRALEAAGDLNDQERPENESGDDEIEGPKNQLNSPKKLKIAAEEPGEKLRKMNNNLSECLDVIKMSMYSWSNITLKWSKSVSYYIRPFCENHLSNIKDVKQMLNLRKKLEARHAKEAKKYELDGLAGLNTILKADSRKVIKTPPIPSYFLSTDAPLNIFNFCQFFNFLVIFLDKNGQNRPPAV